MGKTVRQGSLELLKIAMVFMVSLIMMPVVLLFLVTAVPTWIALLLASLDVVLLGILFTFERSPIVIAATAAGIITVSLTAVILSQKFARTPSILDESGKPLTDSIAVLEQVVLGGTRQWISIRGETIRNPILLYLAGGPGGSDLAWTRKYLGKLEAYFVVVNWDQPGSGKSFKARDIHTLTPEHYLADALELITYLQNRFQQSKIVLVGHSWGTYLGIRLSQAHPHLFSAYVGIGQMVNPTHNDVMGYEFAQQLLQEQGNDRALALLQQQGPPPYYGARAFLRYARYSTVLARYMRSKAGDGKGFPNLTLDAVRAPEYGLLDKINLIRGPLQVLSIVYPQIEGADLMNQASRLDVPVFLAMGRWDVNTWASLAERYYEHLEAPQKLLAWFEHSGHLPHYEEPAGFVEFMVDRVLPRLA